MPVETESSDSEGTGLSSWFLPYTVGLGLRCLVVLEDVSDPDVVTCASAAGFDIVVTTGVRWVFDYGVFRGGAGDGMGWFISLELCWSAVGDVFG